MSLEIKYEIRLGNENDLGAVSALFSSHYASDLTSKDSGSQLRLQEELLGVFDGSTILTIAYIDTKIIGAGLAVSNRNFSEYENGLTRKIGYLSKNVVHSDFRGAGIGKAMVGTRINELRNLGRKVLYSSHHADNIASAKALDAFNFEYVATFLDPEKRPGGSQMTSIRRLVLSE